LDNDAAATTELGDAVPSVVNQSQNLLRSDLLRPKPMYGQCLVQMHLEQALQSVGGGFLLLLAAELTA
jgi:hypothetical protein